MPKKNIPQVMTIVGARPQFIKAALISRHLRLLEDKAPYHEVIIHTGQHYDENMSQIFFEDLNIPAPEHNLAVGSGDANAQISNMIDKLGQILRAEQPSAVLLYGDTNSTLAGAVAASRYDIPVIHVEAGERGFVRQQYPEESNRIVTDNLATLCLAVSPDAIRYLQREGFAPQRVHYVGDPMYDIYQLTVARLESLNPKTANDFGLSEGEFTLATIHRAENTQTWEQLHHLLEILDTAPYPVLLPVHPRIAKMITQAGYTPSGQLKLTSAVSYFDIVSLLRQCKNVFTDSGGVVREAFFSHRPALSPVVTTAWTKLVEVGWLKVVPHDKNIIHDLLAHFQPTGTPPVQAIFGNGKSAENIVSATASVLTKTTANDNWHYYGQYTSLPEIKATNMNHGTYREMLGQFKDAGYKSVGLETLLGEQNHEEPLLFLRHDVTVSLDVASQMAKIEAEEGAKATYYVMLNSPCYNLLSPDTFSTMQSILQLGHYLGLHTNKVSDLPALDLHIKTLETWFDQPVNSISFGDSIPDTAISGLSINHNHTGQITDIAFISDTAGMWSASHPLESTAYHSRKALQLLIHPLWWREVSYTPYSTLIDLSNIKSRELDQSIADMTRIPKAGWLAHD